MTAAVVRSGRAGALTTLLGAVRMQGSLLVRTPAFWMVQSTVPPYTVLFLSLSHDAGRPDLHAAAVLAPVLIAMWGIAIWVSGHMAGGDRWLGTLEILIATPSPYATILLGRIGTVTAASLVTFVEAWLTAWIFFGVAVPVPHPGAFLLTVVVSAAAIAATAVIMASMFVLTRLANTFASSASYPFYVLGGVIVPVSVLPDWVEPFSRVVFLSWSSDLLRDTLRARPVDHLWLRLAIIAGLGALGFAVAGRLLTIVIRRVRETGELSLR